MLTFKLPVMSMTIYVLFDTCASFREIPEHEQRQERLFRARSDQDWAVAWHQETHARCRESIVRHLYWACEKDIYKTSKRSHWSPQNDKRWPFISAEQSLTLLRVRRSSNGLGTITDECCTSTGCTWEEYAEYCPNHRRVRKVDPSY